jgi:hypothetical protein
MGEVPLEKERWDAMEEVPQRDSVGCMPVNGLGWKGCGKRWRGAVVMENTVSIDVALPQMGPMGWRTLLS